MEFSINTIREANEYRARIKRYIVDTEKLRENFFMFVTDDGKGVMYVNAKFDEQINSLFEEFKLKELFIRKYYKANIRFENYKTATIKALPMFAFWENTHEDDVWYANVYEEYEGAGEEFDEHKIAQGVGGICEYHYISIYDFHEGENFQEKAFLDALRDLNLVIFHPAYNLFEY